MKTVDEIRAKIKDLETERQFLQTFLLNMLGESVTADQINREMRMYDLKIDTLKWAINEELPF